MAKDAKTYWQSIKAKYSNAIVLLRCGEYYTTFEEDAKNVSRVLGGATFEYSALDVAVPKLVRAGFRVAIADAIEDGADLSAQSVPLAPLEPVKQSTQLSIF